ncbi:MAG: Porphobilinogen deaminase [Chlamydiae bacterium]|nr:Porphobilinogen deaminase [Chlamydiota bacterium]
MQQSDKRIIVGARESRLSQKQVEEVLQEVQQFDSEVEFLPLFVKTHGDKDRKTSLRDLDKTDFFTKEIDEKLLAGECRIAIHSAKDLPEPLPEGIELIALTRGIDPSDSLVLPPGIRLEDLPKGAKIATSSLRREENVRQMRDDLTFVDIRGTIEERLAKLMQGEIDGLVVARAALIRLDLTHLNRLTLPGETAPLQGQLAILARQDDLPMKILFTKISCDLRQCSS